MTTLRKLQENINIRNSLAALCRTFTEQESMSQHTTFRVGGNASFYAEPSSVENLLSFINLATKECIPFFILGGGSNLVFPDTLFDRIVVSTSALDSITLIKQDDMSNSTILQCGSGCTIDQITAYAVEHCLSGLESFAGLPGTAGGATFMNARCYDCSISDVIASVSFIAHCKDKIDDNTQSLSSSQFISFYYNFDDNDWAYKKSPFQMGGLHAGAIITSISLRVVPLAQTDENKTLIKTKAQSFIDDRKNKGHFRYPSAGSVFKNNREFGEPSGKIIDKAGLRGVSYGGARVAPWHGNFIINEGSASADDIKELVTRVITDVKVKTGFTLEPEILFADEH